MLRQIFLVAALFGLSGCGDKTPQEAIVGAVASLVPAAGNLLPGGGTPSTSGFGAADIAANPGGFRLIGIPTMSPLSLARLTQQNGAGDTWQSQLGYSASFERGLLVATRRLGDDLIAAETGAVLAAIRAGGGTAVRIHDTLNSLDQIVTVSYNCVIVADGSETLTVGLSEVTARKMTETCLGGNVQFENAYWLDDSGNIIASRQFVSQTVAYLRASKL
ncbi:MAG: YjbF family lipoprotein [Rhodobacteraceae bacterium]|nr:YjbF family lipoprotein [Paracoccaceae bacterium]